jgi:hypothetical protein
LDQIQAFIAVHAIRRIQPRFRMSQQPVSADCQVQQILQDSASRNSTDSADLRDSTDSADQPKLEQLPDKIEQDYPLTTLQYYLT